MSGADNIVFNTREKAVSADQNDAQALEARTLATILRFATMSRLSGLGTANDTEVIHPQCNGLQVIPSGSSVLIKPGYLLQESAAITPVPGALDSPYRIALNHANMAPTAVAPSPGSNTFYLLEAQMVEVTALTESRSVLNNTTGNFVATSVPKRKERNIVTAWRAGGATSYPLPTGGDWVVLAGVFRPAGGGAVLQSHIQDMRLQPDLLIGEALIDRATRARVSQVSVTLDGDSPVFISADADVWAGAGTNRGLHLHLRHALGATAGFTPSAPAMLDTTTTLASDTWYYLYLAPWAGLAPCTYYAGIGASRGVPVLSHIPPTAFKSGNSAVLNLPAPFSGEQAAAGTACCIALLRRTGAGSGWRAVQGAGDSYRFSGGLSFAQLVIAGTFPSLCTVAEAQLPRARMVRLEIFMIINFTGTAAATAYLTFDIKVGGSSTILNNQRIPVPGVSGSTEWDFHAEVPYSSTGYGFQLLLGNGGGGSLTAAAGSLEVYCAGWTL